MNGVCGWLDGTWSAGIGTWRNEYWLESAAGYHLEENNGRAEWDIACKKKKTKRLL
jgi:hypothetical protein